MTHFKVWTYGAGKLRSWRAAAVSRDIANAANVGLVLTNAPALFGSKSH